MKGAHLPFLFTEGSWGPWFLRFCVLAHGRAIGSYLRSELTPSRLTRYKFMVLFCICEPSPGLGTCDFGSNQEKKGVKCQGASFWYDGQYPNSGANHHLNTLRCLTTGRYRVLQSEQRRGMLPSLGARERKYSILKSRSPDFPIWALSLTSGVMGDSLIHYSGSRTV